MCGLGLDDEDSDEWYLCRVALHRYKELAVLRPNEASEFRTPRQIKNWLWEQHGIELNTRRWARDYGRFWDKALSVLNEMDWKALEPVASVLHRANDEPAPYFDWNNRLVAMRG